MNNVSTFAKNRTELYMRNGSEGKRSSVFGNYVVVPVFDAHENESLRAKFVEAMRADFEGKPFPRKFTFKGLNEATADLENSMRIAGLAEMLGLMTLARQDGETPLNLDEMEITVNDLG
ncbi:MAG: hypothetical protein GC137_09260 [Alphaproteobacteria bacterium]|nr:hypothetical protein [Alphaproteobacteria bacterium]